jgi:OTU domain-containing protein 5
VGVGLGLAGYQPEKFDPVGDALAMSEQLEIEKMMVEDKLKTTDWEATSDIVVEQIARQSYLQYCKENMSRSSNQATKSTSTITSTATEAGSSSSTVSKPEATMLSAQTSISPGSSSSNANHENDTESTCSIEYYMHHQQTSRRKKRHQG